MLIMKKKIKNGIISILIVAILIGAWFVLGKNTAINNGTEVIFSTGCNDVADLWANLPQDKRIEKCNQMLNDLQKTNARLEGIFEPRNCITINAEANDCSPMLGTQLTCAYECKK